MLSFIAFAVQAAYSAKFSPMTSSPNFIVPASTVRNWFDAGKRASTNYIIHKSSGPGSPSLVEPEALNGPLVAASIPGFTPAQIRSAYNVGSDLGIKAIAIVDAYDYTTALADFNAFSRQFGLPVEPSLSATASSNAHFQVVYSGGTQPAVNADWNGEEALDIEWAHAMAPNAKIYLVEAPDNLYPNLPLAVQFAAKLPNVKQISCSWGSLEFQGSTQLDSLMVNPGVTTFNSTGDTAGEDDWPSHSPNVVAVGGTALQFTQLTIGSNGTYPGGTFRTETVWGGNPNEPSTWGTGGGPSAYYSRPSFQASVLATVGSKRGAPDISAAADPYYGGAVYEAGSWSEVGGTSWACPLVAGIANGTGLTYNSSQDQNTVIYNLIGTTHLRDIIAGAAGPFSAGTGWDFASGCGSPLNLNNLAISTAVPFQSGLLNGTAYTDPTNYSLLAAADSSDYVVSAAPFTGVGFVAGAWTNVYFRSGTTANAQGGVLTVVASANTSNAVAQIFAWNWTTAAYDLLASPTLSSTPQTFSVTLTTAQSKLYVDSTGKARIATRALLPQRQLAGSNQSFKYSIDQLGLSVFFST
jgi:subtilase family serine protease